MTAELALILFGVLVVLVWLALARANRIDLLHQKVTRTAATLDAQLLRRAGLAADWAGSGALPPDSASEVADAARACLEEVRVTTDDADHDDELDPASRYPGRDSLSPEREVVESELSRVLRGLLDEFDSDDLTTLGHEVIAAWRRVALARRFYNEAVAQVERLRAKPSVRILRLAGRAQMPETFEMDDVLPSGWATNR